MQLQPLETRDIYNNTYLDCQLSIAATFCGLKKNCDVNTLAPAFNQTTSKQHHMKKLLQEQRDGDAVEKFACCNMYFRGLKTFKYIQAKYPLQLQHFFALLFREVVKQKHR